MSYVAVTSPDGVERRRLDSEHDLARVVLAGLLDEPQQLGRHADGDHEHAGGVGVERAGVADLALVEPPAQHAHDVVAGDAGRLVDDAHSVRRRRLTPRHRSRAVARCRLRSSRRMSSIRSADRNATSGRKSRIGVFLARIWLAIDACRRIRWSAERVDDLGVAFLAGQRVEVDVGPVELVVDLDARDRHERQPVVVDAHQLLGDDLAQRLTDPRRPRILVTARARHGTTS